MASLSSYLKKSKLSPQSNTTSVHKVTGKYEPDAVMSKVYNSKGSSGDSLIKRGFFNLETHKVSALVPELRFYKVENNIYTPFYLPISTISTDAASTTAPSRVNGVGIKTFNVIFQGTDPFTAPRYLKADLSLYVDNLENIFSTPEPGYARLADLFTLSIANKPISKKKSGGATISSGDLSRPIEIAATLGYPVINRDIFTQQEIDEILSSNIALRMNVFNHQINVEQNGSATIDIEYTARINNSGRDKIFSALDSPEDLLARADLRQLFKAEDKKAGDTTSKKKQKEPLSRKYKRQNKKMDEIRKILEYMDKKGQIYSVKAASKIVEIYSNLGIPAQGLNALSDFQKAAVYAAFDGAPHIPFMNELLATKGMNKNLRKSLSEIDRSEREVYYITFGNLLEALLYKVKESLEGALRLMDKDSTEEGKKFLIKENLSGLLLKSESERTNIKKIIIGALEKMKTFRILLADVTYRCYKGTQTSETEIKRINIADIPISLYTYQKFMYDNVMNSDRNTLVIPQFLEMCLKSGGLLDKALSEWATAGIAPNVITTPPKFTSSTFSGPQLRSQFASKQNLNTSDVPGVQKAFSASNIEDECDYYMIYQKPDKKLTSEKSGNTNNDSKRGIYHFEIGKNRGLIKNISFSKYDIQYQQEALMLNQVGMYDELKMQYTANISMVGNNLFMPGSQIFIDPGPIGFGNPRDLNSAGFRLGLGGYYNVTDVSTKISNGIAVTDLVCYHQGHASSAPESPQLPERPPLAGQLGHLAAASSDPEAQTKPKIEAEDLDYYGIHYQQLLMLKDEETENPIMDSQSARRISLDFQLAASERPESVLGVVSRQTNESTGVVVYHLTTGLSVKMDPRRGERAVTIIPTRKTAD